MALIFPLPRPDGVRSLRFREAGVCTGAFIDNEFRFSGGTGEQIGSVQTGSSPVTVSDTLKSSPITEKTVRVYWSPAVVVAGEDPVVVPSEDGVELVFVVTTAQSPLTADVLTIDWQESSVAKTATVTGTTTIGGTDAADISSVNLNRLTGQLDITFAAGHPPDVDSIRVSYSYVGQLMAVGDMNGVFLASGVTGTIDYFTGEISITITGASTVPYNGGVVLVDYDGVYKWSKGMKVFSTSGGYVEISFDGVNIHGRVDDGAVVEYLDRYEPGVAVRGSGNFVIEAW